MTATPTPPVPPPPAPQRPNPPTSPRKGLSPLAWVAIGCAALLLLAGIAFSIAGYFVAGKVREVARDFEDDPVAAAARLIAAANPEIELVDADRDSRVVVFRNRETGEEFTFDYDAIEEGKVSFTSDDGTASIELDPDEGEGGRLRVTTEEGSATFGPGAADVPGWVPVYPDTSPEGTFGSETPETRSGAYTFETHAGMDDVLDFYVTALEGAGFTIAQRTTTPDGGILVASTDGETRGVSLTLTRGDGGLTGVVNFTEKKPY